MCAFDKTGTLTSDELSFRGVIAAEDLNNNLSKLRTIDNLPESTLSVLSGCHSLITHEKKLLGDPIEKLFFEKA
jgi:cation-transporting ATPase 13A1